MVLPGPQCRRGLDGSHSVDQLPVGGQQISGGTYPHVVLKQRKHRVVAEKAAQVEADEAQGRVNHCILPADLHHSVVLEAARGDIVWPATPPENAERGGRTASDTRGPEEAPQQLQGRQQCTWLHGRCYKLRTGRSCVALEPETHPLPCWGPRSRHAGNGSSSSLDAAGATHY